MVNSECVEVLIDFYCNCFLLNYSVSNILLPLTIMSDSYHSYCCVCTEESCVSGYDVPCTLGTLGKYFLCCLRSIEVTCVQFGKRIPLEDAIEREANYKSLKYNQHNCFGEFLKMS